MHKTCSRLSQKQPDLKLFMSYYMFLSGYYTHYGKASLSFLAPNNISILQISFLCTLVLGLSILSLTAMAHQYSKGSFEFFMLSPTPSLPPRHFHLKGNSSLLFSSALHLGHDHISISTVLCWHQNLGGTAPLFLLSLLWCASFAWISASLCKNMCLPLYCTELRQFLKDGSVSALAIKPYTKQLPRQCVSDFFLNSVFCCICFSLAWNPLWKGIKPAITWCYIYNLNSSVVIM